MGSFTLTAAVLVSNFCYLVLFFKFFVYQYFTFCENTVP